MYDVYINHYKQGGNVIDTETLMFSVPSAASFPVMKPMVKSSEDSSDNFSFSVECNSPFYDSMIQFKTIIRVVYDGDIIFWGRVLSYSESNFHHTRNVICEGMFSYFKDSYYEGVQEKFRNQISVDDFYTKVINNHNAQVPEKTILKGTVGVTLPSETEKYEPTSWTQTSSLIGEFTSNFGGHMRLRYSGGNAYLDWYKYYFRDLGDNARPSVTVGKNILDISSDQDVDNIFTRVIPIGDTDNEGQAVYIDGYTYTDKNGNQVTHSGKAFPVSLVRDLYTNEELTDDFHSYKDYRDAEANFGVIYRTETFADADTKEKLWNRIKKWVKESYFGLTTSFTIKAVDMHIVDHNVPKILLGECVDVNFPIIQNGTRTWIKKKLICKAVQYDLFNPENNSYTFGIPSDLLQHKRSSNKKKEKSASSITAAPKSITGGPGPDRDVTWYKVLRMIGTQDTDHDYTGMDAYYSFKENGEITGMSFTVYDPEEVPSDPMAHQDKWFTVQVIGKITLPGKTTKWVGVSGTRGIVGFVNVHDPSPVTFWYSRTSGYTYEGYEPGISSFEKIAKMIESDPDPIYGGTTNANAFRTNGNITGSARCYDPDKTSAPLTHPEFVFTANIVGMISSSVPSVFVAVSQEYGVFAYSHALSVDRVAHWYQRGSGTSFDSEKKLISTPMGEVYSTTDGSPDSMKTIALKTTELTGQGSEGQILIGHDLTDPGDLWRIKLNVPVQYNDADGYPHIADGFVSASDFTVENIPSFKTKIGIFDMVIAGKVQAEQILADLAYIEKINSQSVSANTYVSADYLFGNNAYVDDELFVGGPVYIENSDETRVDLRSCLTGADLDTTEDGHIKLSVYRADGQYVRPDLISMADTAFFQQAVSAAREQGAAGGHDSVSGGDIDLNGSSASYSSYCPSDPINKSGDYVSGYIWFRLAGGSWVNLRPFSISKY